MDRKYLQSKSGSLEDLATQIASKQSENKVEQKVKLESPKTYLGLKENSVTAVAAKVVAEGFIKEEKFKADYTIEKRAPRHISDEEDESESYGSITVSAKDAGEAKRKIEDEIDKRVDKMKKNPNLKGYSFEGYIDGSVQQVSEGLDPVNKVSVKKDFKNRKDKDIDNDGDVDSTDKYLHTRRQAISKATKSETHTFTAQPMNKKRREAPGEKKVINPIKEGRMKEIAIDVKELSADDFKKKYGETKAEMQKKLGKVEVKEPYAVGMAQAMKQKKDKPPLEKSTITKAHDIAKAIMKKEQKEELNKDDEKAVKKVKDMLKGASAKHASQAKMLDKALKNEEVKYPHKMYSKDGKEVEAKTPADHEKYTKMGYTHQKEGSKEVQKDKTDNYKEKNKKKTFNVLRAEVENGKKTMTGQKPAVIDTEPKTKHI